MVLHSNRPPLRIGGDDLSAHLGDSGLVTTRTFLAKTPAAVEHGVGIHAIALVDAQHRGLGTIAEDVGALVHEQLELRASAKWSHRYPVAHLIDMGGDAADQRRLAFRQRRRLQHRIVRIIVVVGCGRSRAAAGLCGCRRRGIGQVVAGGRCVRRSAAGNARLRRLPAFDPLLFCCAAPCATPTTISSSAREMHAEDYFDLARFHEFPNTRIYCFLREVAPQGNPFLTRLDAIQASGGRLARHRNLLFRVFQQPVQRSPSRLAAFCYRNG